MIAFGGTVRLLGYHRPYVHPVFLAERRILSSTHRIGFATYPEVDYESVAKRPWARDADPTAEVQPDSERVLWVLLAHAKRAELQAIVDHWHRTGIAAEDLLIAYGGSPDEFAKLDFPNLVFVPDADLRSKHHYQYEKQSYQGPMREAAVWLESQPHAFVGFAEQDHVPLVSDWGARMINRMRAERADVLAPQLHRVDSTDNPHYRYHLSDPKFATAWEAISVRDSTEVILDCLCTGTFWRREAFIAVAKTALPTSIYLEIAIPTTAHHLGYRVREVKDQTPFVGLNVTTPAELHAARDAGAWSAHKVNGLSGG